ncbi:MAG: sigma-70 family RNA polymerase sigma factor [Pseudomonadota bacterium]
MTATTDQSDLHALYCDNRDWLLSWLRRRLLCEHDAADLAQDTFQRIIVSGRIPNREQSRQFLLQVAKGLAIDLHRRRSLERSYLELLTSLPESIVPSVEETEMVMETLIEIDQALDALPAKVRETFLLSRFEGLTYSAIAERLDISVGSVRNYMVRAAAACLRVLTPTADKTRHADGDH